MLQLQPASALPSLPPGETEARRLAWGGTGCPHWGGGTGVYWGILEQSRAGQWVPITPEGGGGGGAPMGALGPDEEGG